MIRIYEATPKNPYVFPSHPITLRTACSAGFNRSATVRELIRRNVHPNSVIFPQYGARYGHYDNPRIGCVSTKCRGYNDQFHTVFGVRKVECIQEILFQKLGYTIRDVPEIQNINMQDHKEYRDLISNEYLNFDNSLYNVFVLINEDMTVIRNTIELLKRHVGENTLDLVIVKLDDTIWEPRRVYVLPQSEEAYREFISEVRQFFKFNYTFS